MRPFKQLTQRIYELLFAIAIALPTFTWGCATFAFALVAYFSIGSLLAVFYAIVLPWRWLTGSYTRPRRRHYAVPPDYPDPPPVDTPTGPQDWQPAAPITAPLVVSPPATTASTISSPVTHRSPRQPLPPPITTPTAISTPAPRQSPRRPHQFSNNPTPAQMARDFETVGGWANEDELDDTFHLGPSSRVNSALNLTSPTSHRRTTSTASSVLTGSPQTPRVNMTAVLSSRRLSQMSGNASPQSYFSLRRNSSAVDEAMTPVEIAVQEEIERAAALLLEAESEESGEDEEANWGGKASSI